MASGTPWLDERIPSGVKDPERFLRFRRRVQKLEANTVNSPTFRRLRLFNYALTTSVAVYCLAFADWGSEAHVLTPLRDFLAAQKKALFTLNEQDRQELELRGVRIPPTARPDAASPDSQAR